MIVRCRRQFGNDEESALNVSIPQMISFYLFVTSTAISTLSFLFLLLHRFLTVFFKLKYFFYYFIRPPPKKKIIYIYIYV